MRICLHASRLGTKRRFAAASLLALLIIGMSLEGREPMGQTVESRGVAPPIDRAAPKKTATATFALG